MGLWTKGIERSKTGEPRLEDDNIDTWMKEICTCVETSTGESCTYSYQISPVGHMILVKFSGCVISFPIQHPVTKINLLTNVRYGINNLYSTSPYYMKDKLDKIRFSKLYE